MAPGLSYDARNKGLKDLERDFDLPWLKKFEQA